MTHLFGGISTPNLNKQPNHPSLSNGKRSFRVISIETKPLDYGRYESQTPQGAARKAFNSLCYLPKYGSGKKYCKITFELQETTNKSKHKVYVYEGKRRHLSQEKTIERGGKKIKYSFDNEVRKPTKKYKSPFAFGKAIRKRRRSNSLPKIKIKIKSKNPN